MAFNKDRLKQAYMIAEDGYIEATKKSALYLKDKEGRTIRIGKNYGIQALDSEDTVIHDTPDCIIASNIIYGGHIIWQETPGGYLTSSYVEFTDTELNRQGYTTLENKDLSAYLPTELTNSKGVILYISGNLRINKVKACPDTQGVIGVMWSSVYNQNPYEQNYGMDYVLQHSAPVNQADLAYHVSGYALVPHTWNQGIPYLTWRIHYNFKSMSDNSGLYRAAASIYLQGFLV